jgi:hypothetical protein
MLKAPSSAFLTDDKTLNKKKLQKSSTLKSSSNLDKNLASTNVADLNLISISNNIYTNEGVNTNNTSEIKTLIEFRDEGLLLNEKHAYVSYEPNCNFQEKKFIVDLIRQLKENSLSNDIWFDKDEVTIGSPSWAISRLSALDSSKAAILILTPNYFDNSLNALEAEAIYDLKCTSSQYLLIVVVVCFKTNSNKIGGKSIMNKNKTSPSQSSTLLQPLIGSCDLLVNFNEKLFFELSLSEKVSLCVGKLTTALEEISNFQTQPRRKTTASTIRTYHSFTKNDAPNVEVIIAYEYSNTRPKTPVPYQGCQNCIKKGYKCNKCIKLFKYKKFINLNSLDIQYLLEDIKIDEFYRMNFANLQADGFMLMSCTEDDLINVFDMDNKHLRKRVKNAITGNRCSATIHITCNFIEILMSIYENLIRFFFLPQNFSYKLYFQPTSQMELLLYLYLFLSTTSVF